MGGVNGKCVCVCMCMLVCVQNWAEPALLI